MGRKGEKDKEILNFINNLINNLKFDFSSCFCYHFFDLGNKGNDNCFDRRCIVVKREKKKIIQINY